MQSLAFSLSCFALLFSTCDSFRVSQQNGVSNKLPGGIQLLPGYRHNSLPGIDSQPGEIFKPQGLRINYDIGRVPKPGSPRMGGDYSDWTKHVKGENRRWRRRQVINNQPIHLVYSQDKKLIVSFPKSGANFTCKANTESDLVDAILIIMSYASEPKAAR